eukprot:g82302.t1
MDPQNPVHGRAFSAKTNMHGGLGTATPIRLFYPKIQAACGALTGWILATLLSLTYAFVISSDSSVLRSSLPFVFGLLIISNLTCTGMQALLGDGGWALGGPSLTSAFLLADAVADAGSLETALVIICMSGALFGLVLLWVGRKNILGQILGHRHQQTCQYALPLVHPSFLMAVSLTSALYLLRVACKLILHSQARLTLSKLSPLVLDSAVRCSFLITLGSALLASLLNWLRQLPSLAFLLLVFLVPLVFHICLWKKNSSLLETCRGLRWASISWLDVSRKLALLVVSTPVALLEATAAHQMHRACTAERSGLGLHQRVLGYANCMGLLSLGGLYAHLSTWPSKVGFELGCRSRCHVLPCVLLFALLLPLDVAPCLNSLPSAAPAAALMYLSMDSFSKWLRQVSQAPRSVFELGLGLLLALCASTFGFGPGLCLGAAVTLAVQGQARRTVPLLKDRPDTAENTTFLTLVLHGSMLQGSQCSVLDEVLARPSYPPTQEKDSAPALRKLSLDMRELDGADSSLRELMQGLALCSHERNFEVEVLHAFPPSSLHARECVRTVELLRRLLPGTPHWSVQVWSRQARPRPADQPPSFFPWAPLSKAFGSSASSSAEATSVASSFYSRSSAFLTTPLLSPETRKVEQGELQQLVNSNSMANFGPLADQSRENSPLEHTRTLNQQDGNKKQQGPVVVVAPSVIL